ncbi:hypothetical protein MP638_003094 [Amoeboaphelidium occidentale]|nr:hypothetical protein MP638_003094 [Amoeboaphelidium occidentale]
MNIPCVRITFIVLVALSNLCSCMWYNSYLYTNIDDIEKHLTDVQGKILKGKPKMDYIGNFMKVTEVLMLLSNGAIEEAWNTWQTTTIPNKFKLLYKNSLKATSKEWEFFYSLQSVISVACLKSATEGNRTAAAVAWTTLGKSIAAKNAYSPEVANRILWSDMLELVVAINDVRNINSVKLLCGTHMEIMLHQWEVNYEKILFHKTLPSIDEHNSDSSTTNSNPDNKFVSNSKLKDLALLQEIKLKFLRYYFEDGNTITRPFSHARLIYLQRKYGIEIDHHIPPLSYGSKVCFQLQYEAERPWHTYEKNYREFSRSKIAKDMLNVQDQRMNAILRSE